MDDLYKYIGYGLVSLLLFYIVTRSIRFQLGIIEGLVGIKREKKTDEPTPEVKEQEQEEPEDISEQDVSE
jgi:hypothetical protein